MGPARVKHFDQAILRAWKSQQGWNQISESAGRNRCPHGTIRMFFWVAPIKGGRIVGNGTEAMGVVHIEKPQK
jgi:hypothetical protein